MNGAVRIGIEWNREEGSNTGIYELTGPLRKGGCNEWKSPKWRHCEWTREATGSTWVAQSVVQSFLLFRLRFGNPILARRLSTCRNRGN